MVCENMTQRSITVTTTPVRVVDRTLGYVTDWAIQNNGASDLYLSESSTTGTNGLVLKSGEQESRDDWKGEVWIVSASSSAVVIWSQEWKVGEKYAVQH